MAWMWHRMVRLVRDRRGVAAAEYAIMAVGVVIVVGVAVLVLMDPNDSAFAVLNATVAGTLSNMISTLGASR
jgi:Flp pilus assembly pilin Flp